MYPVGEADVFARKKWGFQSVVAIKQQLRLCQILGGAEFVAAEGVRLQCYNGKGGGSGDWWRRTS